MARPSFSAVAQMANLVTTLSLLFAQTLSVSSLVVKENQDAADVYYVTRMGDRFLGFMAKHQEAVNNFGTSERNRLATAILSAPNPSDKSLLETTARINEENSLEAQNAFSEMRNFVTTLKQAMGAVGSAARCQDLTCGSHAYCIMDKALGAQCLCKDGYQGNGFICKTPTSFTVHALMQFQPGQPQPHVADIHVSALQGDTIVAVYRDISDSHKGYAMLGHASPDSMRWHSPMLFSNESKAFGPMLVELKDRSGGVAIAYRTANRGGDGLLVGGRIDPTSGKMTLGTPKAFARHQAQAVAMLPLSDGRVAVIFAEHILKEGEGQPTGGAMYGASILAQIHTDGKVPDIINKDRFASGPVARISAIQLSPTLFAVAYRQGDGDVESKQAEAACITGELHHSHIVFHAPAVLLEPDQTNIWSRSLARIGENTLAYTYHSGNEKLTKQAILRADPKSHRLQLVQGPTVLAHGFTPVVGSAAFVPSQSELEKQKSGPFPLTLAEIRRQGSARLLTYVGRDGTNSASARLCNVDASGIPSGCRTLDWSGRDIASMSGTAVSDGRYIFVYTDSKGSPYYQFLGLMDPMI